MAKARTRPLAGISENGTSGDEHQTLSRYQARRWWALLVVSLATFMTQLDNIIVVIALPTIRRDLLLSYAQLEWVVSSYILAFASLMLLGGRLADRFGSRLIFLLGLGLFSASSLAAGLAGSKDVLLTGRVGQGIGAALIMPPAFAILSKAFPDDRERGFAVGLWGTAIGSSLAVGPVLGGLISQHWFWGGVFLINVPIGVIGIVAGIYAIAPARESRAKEPLDVRGVVLSFIGLFGITYALINSNYVAWDSVSIVIPLAAALAAWLGFGLAEARTEDPLVNFAIFRNPIYSGGSLAVFLWAFAISGIAAFTSLFLQTVMKLSPTVAGLTYLPMALLMMLMAPLSAPLARRFGAPVTVALGYILTAVGVAGLLSLNAHSHVIDVVPEFALIGLGSGMTMPMQSAVIGALHARWAGVASGVLNAAREVAALLGLAVVSAILAARRLLAMREGATPLGAYADGYRTGLVVAAAALLIGGCVAAQSLRVRHRQAADSEALPEG